MALSNTERDTLQQYFRAKFVHKKCPVSPKDLHISLGADVDSRGNTPPDEAYMADLVLRVICEKGLSSSFVECPTDCQMRQKMGSNGKFTMDGLKLLNQTS